MEEARNSKLSSQWWWFETQKNSSYKNRSPWLQSTLAELDKKTSAMLRIVEEDADSFAQRAEMFYKKRPELISMVQDFYRAHRLLAEGYDQVKTESGARLLSPWALPNFKYQAEKSVVVSLIDKAYDSYSETFDLEESDLSEVEDPEPEEAQIQKQNGIEEGINRIKEETRPLKENDDVVKLKEEMERLKEENRIQKELLAEKDEEKREAIRQLSLAMDLLREENTSLRKRISSNVRDPQRAPNLKVPKEGFWTRFSFFTGS